MSSASSAAATTAVTSNTTKIGVLGTGDVGLTLAAGFAKHGYPVNIGTRSPAKLRGWQRQNPSVEVATFVGAAQASEVLILAVAGWAALECLQNCSPSENLDGKLVIDATNPLLKDGSMPPPGGIIEFFQPPNGHKSLMEYLQEEFPKINFVKGFNCVGHGYMIDPQLKFSPKYGDVIKPCIFICGNNSDAKAHATKLIESVGNQVEDFGPATAAGPIESLCQLWCARGFNSGKWNHAFAVLKEENE